MAVAATLAGFVVAVAVMVVANLVSTEHREVRKNRFHARLFRALPLQSFKILVVLWQILTQVRPCKVHANGVKTTNSMLSLICSKISQPYELERTQPFWRS